MAQLLAIKRRIRAIEGLRKVTRAMELVTHTRIGRVRRGAENARRYHESFSRLMQRVSLAMQEEDQTTTRETAKTGDRHELVIFLSQKGFCGSFNDRLLSRVARELPRLGNVTLSVVGRLSPKWNSIMRRKPDLLIEAPDKSWQRDTSSLAARWAQEIAGGTLGSVIFAFNRFVSILEQTPEFVQVWPPLEMGPGSDDGPEAVQNQKTESWPIVEPDAATLFESLTGPWIEACLARAWWETAAGENCSRLISMKSANENAAVILDDLRLTYNKTRQLVITQELAEISSAFNVLKILKQKREQSED